MNLFLYLFYQFLKGVTIISLRIFYPKQVIINRERLRFKRPVLLVSNHPNTLLDPLNVAKEVPMIVHFLANAGMFRSAFGNWFFNTFYCIPIERSVDIKGRPTNNTHAFARCDEFLGNGGCLYIAPEGGSEMGRHLRPIKTGTARILLSAAEKKDFELGVSIVPVGITYSAPGRFRTSLVIEAGEPIWAKDYKEAYAQDPIATVRQVTAELEERMGQLLINAQDEAQDQLLARLEAIQQTEEELPVKEQYQRSKQLLARLQQLKEQSLQRYEVLEAVSAEYHAALQHRGTTDRAVARPMKSSKLGAFWLFFAAPVFLFGLVNNGVPAAICLAIVRKAKLDPGYTATAKVLGGILLFPLFYGLLTWLLASVWGNYAAQLYFLCLFPSGLLAWMWWDRWQQLRADWNARENRGALLALRNQVKANMATLL